MATTALPRTFKLTSPHLTGADVRDFQHALSARFADWKIDLRVDDDSDFGKDTRKAARQVCRGLGIDPATAMRHGVTPELRRKINDPALRTPAEIAQSNSPSAVAFRERLRKQSARPGNVVIGPNANKPGRPISKLVLDYVGRMATMLDKPIVITTGTNHSQFTVDGNVSDHFSGHAADIGMVANGGTDDSPVGDAIMTCALRQAGLAEADAKAKARTGGLFTITHGGLRIQCIWKTNEGGNHHNHVHVGVRQA
jgi:hypothetical protein